MAITGTNNVPLGKRREIRRGDSAEKSPLRTGDREYRERDKERERERGRDRDRDRDRDSYRERERGRERERERERDRERDRERGRERDRERERGRPRERVPRGFEDRPPSFESKSKGEKKDENQVSDNKNKKKKTRWGDPNSKFVVPGMPTVLPSNMSQDQIKNYLTFLRLEEIGAKLRSNDFMPPEDQRSPSPEPVYNQLGQRVNTRDVRYRKKLEDERHRIIEQAIKENPDFRPPADYRRPNKLAEKYFIPAKEHPDINFIGLLIGPRGNTLKKMEAETGCKISIRGKGSIKEGKRTDNGPIPGIDEELHCLITGDTEEKVQKALKMVKDIISASAAVPEGQNELKRQQLRELASLNGTLRDDESLFCQNCGSSSHRSFECEDQQNFTVNLICKICNGAGHTASDCMKRNDPEALEKARQRNAKLDHEYLKLMNELGEDAPDLVSNTTGSNYPGTYPPGYTANYYPNTTSNYTNTQPWTNYPPPPPPNYNSGDPNYQYSTNYNYQYNDPTSYSNQQAPDSNYYGAPPSNNPPPPPPPPANPPNNQYPPPPSY